MGITDHNTRQEPSEAPDHADPERTPHNIDLKELIDAADSMDEVEAKLDDILEDLPDHDIDTSVEPNRTPKCMERIEGYDSIGPVHDDDTGRTKKAKERLKEIEEEAEQKKIERSRTNQGLQHNQNRMVERIITASPEWFRPDDPYQNGVYDKGRLKEFIMGALRHLRNEYADDSREPVSVDVHLDENTPHIHAEEAPLTDDFRLASSDIYGPQALSEMQTDLANEMPDGIERGEEESDDRHKTKRELQQETRRERDQLRKDVEILEGEVETLKEVAEPVRNHVDPAELNVKHEYVGADPGDYVNPIDYLVENSEKNFAEAVKISAESLGFKASKWKEIAGRRGERIKDHEDQYEELRHKNEQLRDENQTLREGLEDVAEEHGLEIDLGEAFYTDHTDPGLDMTP